MDNTMKKLDRQIDTCIENLAVLETGSDEEVATTNQLQKLIAMRDTYSQKKDRWIDRGLTGLSIGAQLGFGLYGLFKGMKFEEEGVVKSSFFREWRSKFRFLK